jgi:hypothetical protein
MIKWELVFLPNTKDPRGQREKLWREFFSDPSQWWDHRTEKVNVCHHSLVGGSQLAF